VRTGDSTGGQLSRPSEIVGQTADAFRRLDAWAEDGRPPDDAGWRQLLAEHGACFEGRPYPVLDRPLVLTVEQVAAVFDASAAVADLLELALDVYAAQPDVRRRLFAEYEPLAADLCGEVPYAPRIQVSRLDGVWDGAAGVFRVLETNTACPGGVVQTGLVTRLWLTTPAAAVALRGLEHVALPIVDDRHLFARTLVEAATSMGRAPSNAAVVNLRGVYRNEVDHIVRSLSALGLSARLVDARDVSLRDGVPAVDGVPQHLLYNKLDPLALLSDPELDRYRSAFRAGRSCFVSSLPAQLVSEDKAVLALLTDPDYADLLPPAQRRLVERTVPWTRLLRAGSARLPGGERGNLLDFVESERARLVLKPANATRGDGVVHGVETDGPRWRRDVAAALDRRYVVQERVAQPTLPLRPGERRPRHVGLDCFVFGGRPVGLHARASTDLTVNVGKGASVLPVVRVAVSAGAERRVPPVAVAHADVR
jgi:diaminobutyrate-2-oxoglutarate transaminase